MASLLAVLLSWLWRPGEIELPMVAEPRLRPAPPVEVGSMSTARAEEGRAEAPAARALEHPSATQWSEPAPPNSLTLRFQTTFGDIVREPIPVRLNTPDGGPTPEQVSIEGIVRFEGLAPLDGYTWEHRADLPILMNPAIPPAPPGTYRERPPNRSGPFSMKEGSVEFVVTVETWASLSGWIDESQAFSAEIRLGNVRSNDLRSAIRYEIHEERSIRLDRAGAFQIEHIYPGEKSLELVLTRPAENLSYFLLESFTLVPGENRHLGSIGVRGETALIRIALYDVNGQKVSPQPYKERSLPIQLSAASPGIYLFRDLNVSLDPPYVLAGLPAGDYFLEYHADELTEILGVTVLDGEGTAFTLPTMGLIELDILVTQ